MIIKSTLDALYTRRCADIGLKDELIKDYLIKKY